MKLINEKELYFFGNNIASKTSAKLIMRMLGLRKINKLYSEIYNQEGAELTSSYFKYLNTTYHLSDKEIGNIPKDGPLVIVSNHPSGTFDGLLLIDALSKVRPDIKFMGNMLLSRIEPLRDYFIEVNPFDSKSARNISGIRASLKHVDSGGALVIFPAGEISTYKRFFSKVEDKSWSESILKFIRRVNAPILPIYIDANNSKMFHLVGKIHPILRTAMIPRETTNKRNMLVTVRIGSVITIRKKEDIPDLELLGRYIRGNVYCMNEYVTGKKNRRKKEIGGAEKSVTDVFLDDISQPVDREILKKEIADINDCRLFDYGCYSVYFTTSGAIPKMMNEIGRCREVTFREIGEGTNKTIDTDHYDSYYHQLFIWDHSAAALVGAYRVGMGQEIMPQYGLKGFYTDTLFNLSKEMGGVMERTIELGRSFVVKEYQRKPISLLLLWKGILYILLKNEQYSYLMGPITMSAKLSETSKVIIVNYLKKNCFDELIARYVNPTLGLRGLNLKKFDYSLIEGFDTIDYIDKLVLDIERRDLSVPILLKKYLALGGKIIGFNIDPDFNDSIDALMLLDLNLIPESKIEMLSKELEIDAVRRFRK